MPCVAALTLLSVKPPLCVLKGPDRDRDHRQQQAERHVHAEGHDSGDPAQPAQGRGTVSLAAARRCGGARAEGPGIREGSRGRYGLVHR